MLCCDRPLRLRLPATPAGQSWVGGRRSKKGSAEGQQAGVFSLLPSLLTTTLYFLPAAQPRRAMSVELQTIQPASPPPARTTSPSPDRASLYSLPLGSRSIRLTDHTAGIPEPDTPHRSRSSSPSRLSLNPGSSLAPVDRDRAAFSFLAAATVVEMLVWGLVSSCSAWHSQGRTTADLCLALLPVSPFRSVFCTATGRQSCSRASRAPRRRSLWRPRFRSVLGLVFAAACGHSRLT
jgi:hypothetical protein